MSTSENKPVLAMYDVRGKQEFIFRTNKMKEIVGASLIISDVFKDYLYPAAEKVSGKKSKGIYTYIDNDSDFSEDKWNEHIQEDYIGEVIYEGGGNFFVLYDSKEHLIKTNKIFTKNIMENIGTLRVLCSYVEVENFNDYKEDEKRLRAKHRINEARESIMPPVNAIPFVQLDSLISQPIVQTKVAEISGENIPEKTTLERYAKLKKHSEIPDDKKSEYGENILDNLVREKGEDSILAVVFIDGNNMGAQVSQALSKEDENGNEIKSYEACIKELRDFSDKIQRNYVNKTAETIKNRLSKKRGDHPFIRMVVFAGDEMSFICRGEDAMDAIKAYFDCLTENGKNRKRSSCAGVALFHSHAPYAEAYKIAEECCESGKKLMKKYGETETCYLDFQYCQSGLGMDLDTIRERETGDLISKPWLVYGEPKGENKPVKLKEVEEVVKALNLMGARTNIKGLVAAAKDSLEVFNMEMARIYAHMGDEKKSEDIKKLFFKESGSQGNEDRRRKLIYDIGIVYDQWFRNTEGGKKDE